MQIVLRLVEVYSYSILPNGQEIAVKRLSQNSTKGQGEFKNEVVMVAKLQHKNLVGLLGFFLEGEEKILVYEFVPNRSVDYFLYGMSLITICLRIKGHPLETLIVRGLIISNWTQMRTYLLLASIIMCVSTLSTIPSA